MSKRTKFKLLILAAVLCFTAALFAGCSGELKVNDFLNQNNALNQQVTYYGNGGYFDGATDVKENNIYYHVNDYVFTNFESVHGKSIKRDNYVFAGWYYAELTQKLDENGEPELDAEGKPVMVPIFEDKENKIVKSSGNRLEDDLRIQANTHLYVCAHWEKDIELRFILVSEKPITVMVNGAEQTINPGERLTGKNFLSGTATVGTAAPIASTDSTFLQCYSDPECTVPAPNAVSKPSGEDAQEKATVYAKYIEGKWTVVKTKSDVGKMFSDIYTTTKYYIFNDIDCTGESFNPQPHNYNSNCYIEGNGNTISNLRFEYPVGTGIDAGGTYSVFGTFGSTAEIRNLTLENVTIAFTTRVDVNGFYFFCSGDEGAKFENFTIKNACMEVDSIGSVPNIQFVNGAYQSGHWMYGNVETDADFTKAVEGQLKIDGKKLIVQGEVVINESPSTAG